MCLNSLLFSVCCYETNLYMTLFFQYIFHPQVLCCYGKHLCTIPRDATYWTYQNRYVISSVMIVGSSVILVCEYKKVWVKLHIIKLIILLLDSQACAKMWNAVSCWKGDDEYAVVYVSLSWFLQVSLLWTMLWWDPRWCSQPWWWPNTGNKV